MTLVLSAYQVEPALRARQRGRRSLEVSPDLGLTRSAVDITPDGLTFTGGEILSWEDAAAIAAAPTKCFVVDRGATRSIENYSEATGRAYSLMPTAGAPTLLVSGITMHRIKGTEPHADTLTKIRAIAPVGGSVLDTATGLGYTAAEAARTAERVVTIELDPAVLEIARLNPWSQGLFGNPKIEQLVGDSAELVSTLGCGIFSRAIHDPPTMSLAGQLYSGEFYAELCRLLRPNGRLFHYVGDPESRSGSSVTRGVARRLLEAGFTRVIRRPEAFGLVACK